MEDPESANENMDSQKPDGTLEIIDGSFETAYSPEDEFVMNEVELGVFENNLFRLRANDTTLTVFEYVQALRTTCYLLEHLVFLATNTLR